MSTAQLRSFASFSPFVIPAKAGIQEANRINELWIPAFAGITSEILAVSLEDDSGL